MANLFLGVRACAPAALPLACALMLAVPGMAGAARAPRPRAASHRPAAAAARPAPAAPAPAPTAGRAGMVIELGPTRELPDIGRDPSLSRSTEGLVLERRPDGSRHVDLAGRFRAYSAVTVAADGSLRIGCADQPAAALALARAAAAGAPVPSVTTHRAPFGPEED